MKMIISVALAILVLVSFVQRTVIASSGDPPAVAATAAEPDAKPAPKPAAEPAPAAEPDAEPGEILVVMYDPETAESFSARTPGIETEGIYDIIEHVSSKAAPEKRANKPQYSVFLITLVDKSNESMEKAIEYYSSIEGVEYVDRNYIEGPDETTPDDTEYGLRQNMGVIGAPTAFIQYDLNLDGAVDMTDLYSFSNSYFLMRSGDPGWDYARSQSAPAGKYLDCDADGEITMADLTYLYANIV